MLKFIFDLGKVSSVSSNDYQDIYIFLDAIINTKSIPLSLMELNPNNIEHYLDNNTLCLPISGGILIKNNHTDSVLRMVIQKVYQTMVNLLTNGKTYLYNAIFTSPNVGIHSVQQYNHYQYLLFTIQVPLCKEVPKLINKSN